MKTNPSHSPANFLTEELEKRIRKNPNYSLRAFANALDLSPGELSEILRAKRKLSLKVALKIAKGLMMSPTEVERFLSLIHLTESSKDVNPFATKTNIERALSEDLFRVISDWYCVAILSLAEIRGFKLEPARIAKSLGISVIEARSALERLERVGAIKNTAGKLIVEPTYFISSDEVTSEAVRHSHSQLLEKAKESLESQTIDEREVGGITFAVDPKHLAALKTDLKNFLDSWAERLDRTHSQNKSEVYQLETILFRLTKKGSSV